MKELKPGDRCALYDTERYVVTVVQVGEGDRCGFVTVRFGVQERCKTFHRKQLRKLAKKERERVWLGERVARNGECWVRYYVGEPPRSGYVIREFIEVRKAKQ